MKALTTFFILLISSLATVSAQHSLLISFGSSAQEVISTLENAHAIETQVEQHTGKIVVSHNGEMIEYKFNPDGRLYEMVVTKKYENPKEAEALVEGYLASDGKISQHSDGDGSRAYRKANSSEISHMKVRNTKHSGYVVQMVTTSKYFGPKTDTDAVAMDLFE